MAEKVQTTNVEEKFFGKLDNNSAILNVQFPSRMLWVNLKDKDNIYVSRICHRSGGGQPAFSYFEKILSKTLLP